MSSAAAPAKPPDEETAPLRHPRAADAAFGAGLALVAFGARMAAALSFAAEPVWDGQYYDFGARRIASGFGYGDTRVIAGSTLFHPWCHYPVGYSAYLSVFYKFFGPTALTAHVADALAGALLALVTFLLAREALSPARARLAGALVALHPGLVLYGALVMTEPLASLLTLTAFFVALRQARPDAYLPRWLSQSLPRARAGTRGVILGALVLGVGALVRPQALLCAPFLGLAGRARSLRGRLGAAVLACAVALIPVLPWTLRNCRVMDGCALVSTNAGWNLAIGAFPRATGRFETLRSADGCREVTGQVQQDRCWFDYGVSNILAAPGRWLSLVPKKLGYTFDHESFAVEYLHEARPSMWPEPRRAAARALVTSVHRWLVVFAMFAFVGRGRWRTLAELTGRVSQDSQESKRTPLVVQGALALSLAVAAYFAFSAQIPTFWPLVVLTCALPWLPLPGRPERSPALTMLVAFLATTVATHAVFFGEDRYHVVVTPVLCILAAAALRPSRARPGGACPNASDDALPSSTERPASAPSSFAA